MIRFPVTLTGVKYPAQWSPQVKPASDFGIEPGTPVKVQLTSEPEANLGVYLGCMAHDIGVQFVADSQDDPQTGRLNVRNCGENPAILVLKTGRIVMGYESFWEPLRTPSAEELRQIAGALHDHPLTRLLSRVEPPPPSEPIVEEAQDQDGEGDGEHEDATQA